MPSCSVRSAADSRDTGRVPALLPGESEGSGKPFDQVLSLGSVKCLHHSTRPRALPGSHTHVSRTLGTSVTFLIL